MASAPHHPIALDALLRITHATADAVDWAHDHATEIKHLKESGQSGDLRKLLQTDVLSNPKDGGPIGVMAWTGPGVWTDAVLRCAQSVPATPGVALIAATCGSSTV
jgi:alpha 1,6-mannosyltransferase